MAVFLPPFWQDSALTGSKTGRLIRRREPLRRFVCDRARCVACV